MTGMPAWKDFWEDSIYTNEIIERKSNVLIIDEAHSFESVFCEYITTYLSARILA